MRLKCFVLLFLLSGCSKASNPINFYKIAEPTQRESAPHDYTLLDLYLMGQVSTDYMIDWFFKDYKSYRYKLFYIKSEIASKLPFSQRETERTILLQYTMNDAIRKFNERNFFFRSKEVISAAIHPKRKKGESQESFKDILNEGASAKHIGDSFGSFFRSFTRYGFKIEEVKLLDDQYIHEKSYTH